MTSFNITDKFQLLPFTGRSDVVAHILKFVNRTTMGDESSLFWIDGIAGIGKSRLLEQVMEQCRAERVIPLCIRFYPEGRHVSTELLCEQINTSPSALQILREPVTNSLPTVINALRRLTRLRPTLLLFEDLHLLEETEELTRLLGSLSGEPVAILCTSRPIDSPAHKVLLPRAIEHIQLPPLTSSDLRSLLAKQNLFIDQETAHLFHKATEGIPFFVRALLPHVIATTTQAGSLASTKSRLASLLQSTNQALREGLVMEMTTSLTQEELAIAKRLATLGEIISYEGAGYILRNKDCTLLSSLIHKGILATSHQVRHPIIGALSSHAPLTFTHTLLHQELASKASVSEEELFQVLEESIPLFSLFPLVLLAELPAQQHSPERFLDMMQALQSIVGRYLLSPTDLRILKTLHSTFKSFLAKHATSIPDYVAEMGHMHVLVLTLNVGNQYKVPGEEQGRLIHQLLAMTSSPKDIHVALYRLFVLHSSQRYTQQKGEDQITIAELMQETEELVQLFPELLLEEEFLYLAGSISASNRQDISLTERLDLLYQASLKKTRCREDRLKVLELFGCPMLRRYSNVQEVTERRLQSTKIQQELAGLPVQARLILWVIAQGNAKQMQEVQAAIQLNEEEDSIRALRLHCFELEALAAFGLPEQQIEEKAADLFALYFQLYGNGQASSSYSATLGVFTYCLYNIGVLLNRVDWALNLINHFVPDVNVINQNRLPVRALLTQNRDLLSKTVETLRKVDTSWYTLLAYTVEHASVTRTEFITTAHTLLRQECLESAMTEFPVFVHAAINMSLDSTLQAELANDICAATRSALTWSFERDLAGSMQPLLEVAQHLLPENEYVEWKTKREGLHSRLMSLFGWNDSLNKNEEDRRIRLSMIGNITICKPKTTPENISGGRARRILGLMVANQILETSLSPQEFRRLAIDRTKDHKQAGKYLHTFNSRLRKILGSDAIIADRKTAQRINTNLISVDVFEVDQLMKDAQEAVYRSRPRRACHAVRSALHILRAGPTWPTLYDEFFESARSDFDHRVSTTIIMVATFLQQNGDLEEAQLLLQEVVATMPSNPEIVEKLTELMGSLGRKAEAMILKERSLSLH